MASIGPALDVPEGRPNRRFIAVATLVAVAVILAVAALLIGGWLVRETVVWLVAVPVTRAIEILVGAWREGRAPTLEPPLPEPGDTAVP